MDYHLPDAALRLRPYDAVMAAGGSVQDFMAQAALPVPEVNGAALAAPRWVNEGLHRALIEIVRRCNTEIEAGH